MTAAELNAHLESDGVVIVSTYNKSTQYNKKHAGWFSQDKNGNFWVKYGKKHNQLSIGDLMLVKIRMGRFVLENGKGN